MGSKLAGLLPVVKLADMAGVVVEAIPIVVAWAETMPKFTDSRQELAAMLTQPVAGATDIKLVVPVPLVVLVVKMLHLPSS